ncbi:hypothetical protein QGN23_13295 [Chryseobacterium gotjawalense]|uniref:Uncharacterized protein n=1 Tax=Chryseobacterium gotjawalense TaxID=3042315 RepID=A0ABY8REE7_9FLAO|nr:hypothetical protein [Chryseobacterium sp. wdc7]WHF51384.1 hypothetical protein QGN23_13295 [Chryseobacterium sp. wdc7]
MNKQSLIYAVIVFLIFISGLIIGSKMNQNGRFQTTDMSLTTDTKKGILYIFRGKDFIVINLKTGERKLIPIKKLKSDNAGFDEQNLYEYLLGE